MEGASVFFNNMTFIGVDPTAGEKPMVYAAVDHERHVLALGEGKLDDVLAFAAGQRQSVLAVCGPRQPNLGLMRRRDVRERLDPPPSPGRWENFRLVEFLLRRHNLYVPPTPDSVQDSPNWMQQSYRLFQRLIEMGYQLYPQEGAERWCLEVYPHAVYSVLLGLLPYPKNTLEGRLQRQLVLYENELNVPDAMDFFEEITRHRLLKGVLPLDGLYSPGELDALAAAFCAWLAVSQPERVTLLGDPEEGQILLPAAELKKHYSQVSGHASTTR
jgi:hypothetical protein